jgi:hypothetical protein
MLAFGTSNDSGKLAKSVGSGSSAAELAATRDLAVTFTTRDFFAMALLLLGVHQEPENKNRPTHQAVCIRWRVAFGTSVLRIEWLSAQDTVASPARLPGPGCLLSHSGDIRARACNQVAQQPGAVRAGDRRGYWVSL